MSEEAKKRNEIYSKLITIRDSLDNNTYKVWIDQVIEFIKVQNLILEKTDG